MRLFNTLKSSSCWTSPAGPFCASERCAAGPSFHAGLSVSPSPNPLKQVLDIIGETVPCKQYDRWVVYDSKGQFDCVANEAEYKRGILSQGGPEALKQWEKLEESMKPLQAGAAMLPAAGMRDDLGVVLTAGYFGMQAGWAFAQTGLQAGRLTGPFCNIVDEVCLPPQLGSCIALHVQANVAA